MDPNAAYNSRVVADNLRLLMYGVADDLARVQAAVSYINSCVERADADGTDGAFSWDQVDTLAVREAGRNLRTWAEVLATVRTEWTLPPE